MFFFVAFPVWLVYTPEKLVHNHCSVHCLAYVFLNFYYIMMLAQPFQVERNYRYHDFCGIKSNS